MPASSIIGKRLPPLTLARADLNGVRPVPIERFLMGRQVLLFGVAGAYTPICTDSHVPEYIAKAATLKRMGYAEIVCVCPNDPWVTAAWASEVDPHRVLTYLSDGNLDLARHLACLSDGRAAFAGRRPRRYVIGAKDVVVERCSIESKALVLTCTRAQDVVLEV